MKITQADDGALEVRVRQSWLSNARDCLEKGRLDTFLEERVSSDLAAIGTAVHAAAEFAYHNTQATEFELVEHATQSWKDQCNQGIRWTKMDEGSGLLEVQSLTKQWHRQLRRVITKPVAAEYSFDVLFDTFELNGQVIRVYLTGTMDLVQEDSLWDWKTSGRKYNWYDKQNESVQASVYAAAAVRLGLLQYPVQFNFAVMLRGTTTVQICDVLRTEAHEAWLREQIRALITHSHVVGFSAKWPMNDQGALCSPDWCDHWSVCKGQHVGRVSITPKSRKAQ
jgi:hypothetical protein